MSENLTVKQEKFCQAYFLHGNASEAYRLSYNCEKMKPETINRKAKELMDNGKISARITQIKKDTYDRNKATIDEVISIASDILRADIADLFDEHGVMKDIKKVPKPLRMALAGIETNELKVDGFVIGQVKKIRMSDRTKIIEMFMKHYGEFARDNEQKKSHITIFKLPDNGR